MRKGGKCEFLVSEDKKTVIGVVLGGDFCAEHEWGIEDVKTAFGIPENKTYSRGPMAWWKSILGIDKPVFGIEKRTITKLPEGYTKLASGETSFSLATYSGGKKEKAKMDVSFIGMSDNYSAKSLADRFADKVKIETYRKSELDGWWSDRDFLISSENKEFIRDIREAFDKKDIAIWVGKFSENPFEPAGFVIAIKSRIPEQNIKSMYEADEDYYNLQKTAAKTGIYEKLEKAERKYFALSPRWANEEKTEVQFWLNPEDQRNNNFGWYTVKDLEAWIKGEGPIPKIKEAVK